MYLYSLSLRDKTTCTVVYGVEYALLISSPDLLRYLFICFYIIPALKRCFSGALSMIKNRRPLIGWGDLGYRITGYGYHGVWGVYLYTPGVEDRAYSKQLYRLAGIAVVSISLLWKSEPQIEPQTGEDAGRWLATQQPNPEHPRILTPDFQGLVRFMWLYGWTSSQKTKNDIAEWNIYAVLPWSRR